MATINPYLNFNGTTEEAFNFYKSVLGGEFASLQRFKDTPDGHNVPDTDKNKIMHISLPIEGNVIMGTDVPESMGQVVMGTNFSLSLSPDSEEETRKLFDGLSAGGKITMPLEKMFWGALFGMFTDKFGIQWMINFEDRKA